MLAIEVDFLTGRFVATAHNDRDRPEWPPHPARLFSALVATWADSDRPDPEERIALEWLEAQGPPDIAGSEATARAVVTHYVPVNDAAVVGTSFYDRRSHQLDEIEDALDQALVSSAGEVTPEVEELHTKLQKARDVSDAVRHVGTTPESAAQEMLPSGRVRQARTYPSVTPIRPVVTFTWSVEAAPEIRSSLDRLLSRVTRIGHSSSLVSCRLVDEPPAVTWEAGSGQMMLRSVRSGQLAALESEHRKHQASRPRSLPFTAVAYRSVPERRHKDGVMAADTAGDWIVYEFAPGSRRLPATRTVEVAQVLRAAVFSYADDPLPPGLTGHQADGRPLDRPHVGFLALPFVGVQHADGRLMGVAIGLPDALDPDARTTVLRAIGTWERTDPTPRLTLGPYGVLEMTRLAAPSEFMTLNPAMWRRRSRSWVSATPVALPRHPGNLNARSGTARQRAWERAEHAVTAACRHVGLPEPIEVTVSLQPFTSGPYAATRYPAFQQANGGGTFVARRLVHVAVTFDRPVDGPLVLGSGRYLGLGLMRPTADRESSQ